MQGNLVRVIIACVALAVSCAAPVAAFAGQESDERPPNGWTMGPGAGMGMDGMGGPLMGEGALRMLNLSDQQRTQVNKIQDDLRRQHWATMGNIMDLRAQLRDLYAADRPDPKQVGNVYSEIAALRRQMIEASVDALNRIQDLLNDVQRQQLREIRRGRGAHGMHGRQGEMPMNPSR